MRTLLALAASAASVFAAEIPSGAHVLLRIQSTVEYPLRAGRRLRLPSDRDADCSRWAYSCAP